MRNTQGRQTAGTGDEKKDRKIDDRKMGRKNENAEIAEK